MAVACFALLEFGLPLNTEIFDNYRASVLLVVVAVETLAFAWEPFASLLFADLAGVS